MSGMGGLALKLLSRAKKLRDAVKIRLVASSKVMLITGERHILMIGKLLISTSTNLPMETWQGPRKNLETVKMMWKATKKPKDNPQGYDLSPKIKKTGYGQPSETERMWVFNESVVNLRRLKIQSALGGDFKDQATPIRLLYYYFLFFNEQN